uniref:Uncharacterized protein LOC100373738 n=1 Tax=Saccoglossus kowalevskii TaxID=10224 RepID=A0ABM0GXT4_SACKO|nr:PREDICTED: uncharacterized protein LOC100373738 [Saccoglossus kowalevskii]
MAFRWKKTKFAVTCLYLLIIINFLVLFYYVHFSTSEQKSKFGGRIISEAKVILRKEFLRKIYEDGEIIGAADFDNNVVLMSRESEEKQKAEKIIQNYVIGNHKEEILAENELFEDDTVPRNVIVAENELNEDDTVPIQTDSLSVHIDNNALNGENSESLNTEDKHYYVKYLEDELHDSVLAMSIRGKLQLPVEEVQKRILPLTNLLTNHEGACRNLKGISLVTFVTSLPENVEQRETIRNTWGKVLKERYNAAVMFVIGVSLDDDIDIRSEHVYSQDIIQTSFLDTSKTRILKTITMLRWITEFCANAKFILKTNDATFIQPEILFSELGHVNDSKIVIGRALAGIRPQRDPNKHTFVSIDTWPESRYPVYLENPTYILSGDVAHELYVVAMETHLFPHDDVYLGILLHGIDVELRESARIDPRGVTRFICDVSNALSISSLNKNTIETYWNTLEVYPGICKDDETFEEKQLYVQNPYYQCAQASLTRKTVLLFLIFSDAVNAPQRYSIRDTWANYNQMNLNNAITIFVIRMPKNKILKASVEVENHEFADILVLSNNLGKIDIILSALQWVKRFCYTVSFVVRVEDDVIFLSNNLLKVLEMIPNKRLALGDVRERGEQLFHRKGSQWVLDSHPSPSLKYIDSHAYVISYDLIGDILHISENYKMINVSEESYFAKIFNDLNINLVHHPGFDSRGQLRHLCDLNRAITSRYMSSTDDMMFKYWKGINEWAPLLCHSVNLGRSIMIGGGSKVRESNVQFSPHDYVYLINEPEKCSVFDSTQELTILLGIVSRARESQIRHIIRSTWGSKYHHGNVRVVSVFMIGTESNGENKIAEESYLYGDIIQENIKENYKNLTLKTIMLLKWASTYCTRVDYVIKIDTDVFLNVDNMVELLKYAPRTSFYLGETKVETHPIRQPRSKWYTPVDAWIESTYPPYNDGHAYVMSIDVVQKAYHASMTSVLFPWEDVYIGNLLANFGVAPLPHKRFDRMNFYKRACDLRHCLTSHGFDPMRMFYSWSYLEKCNTDPNGCICNNKQPGHVTFNDLSWNNKKNIRHPSDCLQSDNADTFLLVVVMTSSVKYSSRMMARLSWAMPKSVDGKRVQIVFLVGSTEDVYLQTFIFNENIVEQDILVGRFPEHNSAKGFSEMQQFAIQWSSQCGFPEYMMFVTEDMFVNVDNVVRFLVNDAVSSPLDAPSGLVYHCIGSFCKCKQHDYPDSVNSVSILSHQTLRKLVRYMQHLRQEPALKQTYDLVEMYQLVNVSVRSPHAFDVRGRYMYRHSGMCKLHQVLVASHFTTHQSVVAQSFLDESYYACANYLRDQEKAIGSSVCTAHLN